MYSRKQVAEILNLHYKTIENMIKRGDIHAVKIGRQWRISEEELQRVMKGE